MMIRQILSFGFLLCTAGFLLSACAGAAVGLGSAAVAASTTEKGFSTSVSDSVIFAKLKDKFIQTDAALATSITSAVNDGSVLLTGRLDSQEQKTTATRLAWEIKGVREVVNEVQVADQPSLKDRAKDFAASAQLRTALIADQNISSLNYSIDVVSGVVYVSGVAADDAERNRVIAHAQELRFAKKVLNYIILETDKRD